MSDNLDYAITLDSAAALAAMQRFDSGAGSLINRMSGMGRGAATATSNFSGLIGSAARMAVVAGTLATGLGVVAGAFLAIKEGVSLAAQFEQTNIAFKTLTGSAETARSVISTLSKMAIDTPFKEGELQGTAKSMLAARVPAEALKGELLAMGNIASATGADIERLSVVYAQVAGKGKLYAEELQQFVEQGAGELRQAVAESMGVTTAKLMDLMSEGKVGFSDLQQSIQKLAGAGGKWGQAMEEQSKTTLGLLSSLQDGYSKILRMLAQPINDGPIKSFMTSAVEAVTSATSIIEQALAQNKIGAALENAIILGAKMGVNKMISLIEQIPALIESTLKRVSQAIQLALAGSFKASKDLLGGFDLSNMRFDTANQDAFFANLRNGAKVSEAAAKETGNAWAKSLDSKTEDKNKKSGGGSGNGDDAKKKRAQDMSLARNDTLGELAMLRAQVNGHNAKADAINRSLRIQRDYLNIMRQTGASEQQALKLATEKANIEDKRDGKARHIGGVKARHDLSPKWLGTLGDVGPLAGGGLEEHKRLQQHRETSMKTPSLPGYRRGAFIPRHFDPLSGRIGTKVNRDLGAPGNRDRDNAPNGKAQSNDPVLGELQKITSELTRIRTT